MFGMINVSMGCFTNEMFEQKGWIIHDSEQFDAIVKDKIQELKSSVESGKTVFDMQGVYENKFSYVYFELFKTEAWISTPVDYVLRRGDFVFTTVAASEGYGGQDGNKVGDYVEVRWFDGNDKHIVSNLNLESCISTKPPLAMNTLF
jgi:hypothetical protein